MAISEIDARSAEMYARIAALLDEEQEAKFEPETGYVSGVPDLGADFESRLGTWEGPRIFKYEGKEVINRTENGLLAIEVEQHPDLAGRALVVKPLDETGEKYFIMLLSAATNPAVSMMDWEDPNRDLIKDKYGVLPAVHGEDPTRGIHFQGVLSYPSTNNNGGHSMVFSFESQFTPPGVENREAYEKQQQSLAEKYLTVSQPELGGITLVEGLMSRMVSHVYTPQLNPEVI